MTANATSSSSRKRASGRSQILRLIIGIPVALIVGAYHGWLLTIARARPLWNTGPAMVAAIVGFVTTGMAAVLSAGRRRLSLVDCVSFDVMTRLGIDVCFAFDAHFREQGFRCIP